MATTERNPLLEQYPYPGKFEGELVLAQVLWDASMDSGADEDDGPCSLFLNLPETYGELDGIHAAILEETEQGFVYATYYDTDEEARTAWDALVADRAEMEVDGY